MKKALVLGGGIQGCCISLMLCKHDYEVTIIDKSKDIINKTSRSLEGKIHLGFNYGMDTSLKTGKKLMLDGLYFSPYIEYLLDEKVNWENFKSLNFNYLVAKDSLLSSGEVATYFQTLQTYYEKHIENEKLNYLGKRPKKLFQQTSIPKQIESNFFETCFSTEEVALHPESFKEIIKQKVHSENITLCLNQFIASVKKTPSGFMVETQLEDGNIGQFESDEIFNCLWTGRIDIDKQMGMKVEKGINLRFKYIITTKVPSSTQELSSFTVIQGPYGDYVNYPQRKESNFCWYPSSMTGMIVDQKVPQSWEEASDGNISETLRQTLINENFIHFQRLIPTLSDFKVRTVRGCVIMGKGQQDIHDPKSKLHERSDFPITHDDGYYSISTAKYTSAPHNTFLLEKMLGYDSF